MTTNLPTHVHTLEIKAQHYDAMAENLYFEGRTRLARLYWTLANAARRLSWVDWPAPKRGECE